MSDFTGLKPALHALLREAALAVATGIQAELADAAPVGKPRPDIGRPGGELRKSIRQPKVSISDASVTIDFGFDAPYAKYLDEGTAGGRYPIYPTGQRSFLRWPGPGGGFIYRRSVSHPGSDKHKGWFSDKLDTAAVERFAQPVFSKRTTF